MMARLFAVGRARVALFLALSIVLGALISADAFVLQWLIDAVQNGEWARFRLCAVLAVVILVVQSVVYWGRQTYSERMSYLMLGRLRQRMFDGISAMPLTRMKDLSADRLFSQMTSQLEQVKADLIDVLLYGTVLASQVAFAVVSILAINPVLGAFALLLCLPMALVPVASKRRVRDARNALVDAQNELNDGMGDLLRGMPDWRLMRRERLVRAYFTRRNRGWLGKAYRDADTQMGVDAVTNALSRVLIFGIWLAGGLLIMQGTMRISQVVALYALIGNISVPMFQLSGLVAQYHAGRETLLRLEGDLSVRPSRTPAPMAPSPASGPAGAARDGIRFTGVRLHRVGRPFDLGLDLSGRYVVEGPSGGGKSSLLRALVGLDDDYDGSIAIGGVDARSGERRVAARIGYLSQQSHIFRGSVRENVRMFDASITDDVVMDALRRAQLGDWADARGLDRQVDDSLNLLSGGERQRLLIARTLAQGYRFCLLDEFDTGLDNDTVDLIERVLLESFDGFIAVTHRPGHALSSRVTAVITMGDNTLAGVETHGRAAARS